MATVAGVGDAVFLCEQRVGNGEPVIAPGVALHVGGLRHVTIHTLSALAVQFVMRMRGRINFRAVGIGAGMAAHAKRVAGLQDFGGVRLVAVHAAHAGMVHFAAEKRGEDVVLLPHLAVGVVDVRLVGDDMREVVKVRVARFEVPRQLRATRVTFAAGREPLCVVELAQCRVFVGSPGVLLSPVNVGLHRAVTRLAANAHLRHCRKVRVGRFVVIFSQARVVARGALGIPVHAAPGPVPPLAGLTILIAKDIEPLVLVGIMREIHGLQESPGEPDQILPDRCFADDTLYLKRLFLP